jgi:quercetin dioxygenase-like cupin family protein
LLGRKTFDQPDEVRRFERGVVEVVNVGDHSVARATFQPGWRWSEDVKPIAQTPLCDMEHELYFLSGGMRVRMEDGTEAEFKRGDVVHLMPNHDAWIVGDEPCVVLDWGAASTYAKK